MTERERRIATKEGFIAEFWDELRRRRRDVPTTTQISVYYYLNDLYEQAFGSPLWSSWDAFRKFRDRL